jgi:4-hydroxy-tetrahydrodipicolinate synthase
MLAMETTTISGAYTALPTPFTEGGDRIDFERLDAQLRFQVSAGIRGVVPCGTTGETPTLSHEEWREVICRTVETGSTFGLQVIAGAGSNSTAKAIDLQREAEACGVDMTLQVVPYYNKPSQEGLFRHFHAIADAATVGIILYDVPGRTCTALAPDTVARLAEHPRIVALKAASGSIPFITEVTERCSLSILSGDDPITLAIQCHGGVGVISVVSNLVPDQVSEMCDAANRGDLAQARSLHQRHHELATALVTLDSNPVPLKAAMAMLDRDTGVVRPPLAPMSEAARAALREALEGAGLVPLCTKAP